MDYLNNLENSIREICNECSERETEKCSYRKCNIGFGDYVVKNIKDKSIYFIPDGESLIPKDDFKYYDEKVIASGIANICRLCKDCNEKHNENCVIALARRTLEYTQLKSKVSYPGNAILYLMNVSKERPEFAELIKQEYMRIG
ncbi:hypothetical protein Curi_c27570 [Gottschalkia acidurici 9a]|uniref:Uncharacterized protein n=1 Tax=Gottschalkia acidurici (strain ATCC 7906 / DSM 604 / BCRC 14475 / CIP 104303 / KCTC 5404 / NCIMB 10678 / 9a) TaxID=1128398 RepID=K0B482_GOTA9|nr:hypothetical protein [Gottschalkia acidurici]AFS79750.1 hypothetical protein Curi_c27570 [Gottschalkia acidurici 9a]